MLKKHSSLMAYFGSKRKLCRHIFKHLDRPKAQLFSIKHNWLRSLSKKDKGDELMLIDLKKWYD
mgnify:CR=1 FL=1